MEQDTIAAISTPSGPGAIGILRLSGPRAADIAQANALEEGVPAPGQLLLIPRKR